MKHFYFVSEETVFASREFIEKNGHQDELWNSPERMKYGEVLCSNIPLVLILMGPEVNRHDKYQVFDTDDISLQSIQYPIQPFGQIP